MFGYKSKITQDQFFKYGFAEMKMLLCCDAIALVKRKAKHINTQRSLSAKRVMFTRSQDCGRYTSLAHDQGKQTHYYYERDANNKTAKVSGLTDDLQAVGTNTPVKKRPASGAASGRKASNQRFQCSYKQWARNRPVQRADQDAESQRTRSASAKRKYSSLESYERLTGSLAF